jgi:hypothetical protein
MHQDTKEPQSFKGMLRVGSCLAWASSYFILCHTHAHTRMLSHIHLHSSPPPHIRSTHPTCLLLRGRPPSLTGVAALWTTSSSCWGTACAALADAAEAWLAALTRAAASHTLCKAAGVIGLTSQEVLFPEAGRAVASVRQGRITMMVQMLRCRLRQGGIFESD